MAHDVFISYASSDKSVADAACAKLEAEGIRCWIAPRDILPGREWGASIIEAIESARIMMLVFSSNANTSQQIPREVERAVSKGLPIIPFRIEDVVPSRNLEYFLSTPHWLDAMTPPLERHLEYLAETVKLLLGRRETAPERPVVAAGPAAKPLTLPPALLNRNVQIVGVVAVLVLLLVLFGRGLIEGSAPVDSALVGSWNVEPAVRTPGPEATVSWVVSLSPNGQYSALLTYDETGVIVWGERAPSLLPAKGISRGAQWNQSADTVTTANLVPASLSFAGNNLSPGYQSSGFANISFERKTKPNNARFPETGTWESAIEMNGLSWLFTVEIDDAGRYAFHAETRDKGKLTTKKDGTFKQVSGALGIITGKYDVADKDVIAFTVDPIALKVSWKRADPAAIDAKPEPTPAPKASTLPINFQIGYNAYWSVGLQSMERLADGRIKANVVYYKTATAAAGVTCPTAPDYYNDAFLTLNDGTEVPALELFCDSRPGQAIDLASGQSYLSWAIFPPIPQSKGPIRINWYNWGALFNVPLPP
jgi:hypothetical protein